MASNSTGWDNGLCQDYNGDLGRWFANRLGAGHQLRKDFEMNLTKDQALSMLFCLFQDNKLTFRSMATLKAVFDEAVEAVNDERSENLASHRMGRSAKPDVFDKDIEDQFYDDITQKASSKAALSGFSEKALSAIAEFAVEEAGYTTKDML